MEKPPIKIDQNDLDAIIAAFRNDSSLSVLLSLFDLGDEGRKIQITQEEALIKELNSCEEFYTLICSKMKAVPDDSPLLKKSKLGKNTQEATPETNKNI